VVVVVYEIAWQWKWDKDKIGKWRTKIRNENRWKETNAYQSWAKGVIRH
jgi:hypothetical protein